MAELGGPLRIRARPELYSSAENGHWAAPGSGIGDKYRVENTSNGAAGKVCFFIVLFLFVCLFCFLKLILEFDG